MPQLKNRVNFDVDTKTSHFRQIHKKSRQFRSPTPSSSQFRPPTLHPNQLHAYIEIKSNLIPDTETKSISTTHINKVNSDAHTKTSSFRQAHENKVNFKSPTKKKPISIIILKSCKFVSPTQNHVKFDPRTEVEWRSIPTLNQVNFSCAPTQKTN